MKKERKSVEDPEPMIDLVGEVLVPFDQNPSVISQSEADKLTQQMDYARQVATDCPKLSEEESKLYWGNCRIIRETKVAIVLRNHALLQVFECRQWREQYASVRDFAKAEADLSKSQLYKCLDEARIVDVFAREKLTNCMPTGRCVEELVKVIPDHWIAAWTYALQQCGEDGPTRDKARDVLRDYCRDRKLSFGRKQNGKNWEPSFTSFLLPTPKESANLEKKEWMQNLSPDQERCICGALSETLIRSLEGAFKNKRPAEIVLETLSEADSVPGFSEQELQGLSLALGLMRENDPESYKRITLQALGALNESLNRRVQKRGEKNKRGRAEYMRQKEERKPKASSL